MRLVLATRNAHKLREVQRVLEPYGVVVEPLPERVRLPPEVGETFAANALPKARTAFRELGGMAIADDSGIQSAALDGRPGVRSARFAGAGASDAENLAKLIAEAPAGGELRYVCALAFVGVVGEAGGPGAGLQERVFFGECVGRMAAAPRGTNGFGYDPVFVPAEQPGGLTVAQLSDAAKDAISHRGRALTAFARWFSATRGST